MGYLSERVSYLRGVADGLKINEETSEGIQSGENQLASEN